MRPRNSSLSVLVLIIVLVAVIALFISVVKQDKNSHLASGNYGTNVLPPSLGRTYQETRQQSRTRSMRSSMQAENCSALGVTCSSNYFQAWSEPMDGACHTSIRNGYPIPDPRCTPGGFNSAVTLSVMQDPGWRTRCTRDCEVSQAKKHAAYGWYQVPNPQHNSGSSQVCELDHLVPLELGGADGMGNIWPQCGPDDTDLRNRYFKMKDRVENYLADEVKSGRMPLDEAQRGSASDWTQFLDEANRYCANGGRC